MKRCLRCSSLFDGAKWQCPKCGFAPTLLDAVPCFSPELAEQSEGYDSSRYETISQFQNEHFWFRGRNELICSQLQRYFPQTGNLLEIGCGTGQVLQAIRQALPAARFCGTEIHSRGLAYAAKELPGVELLQIDARALPFAEEFDVVCAFDVIEHVDDDVGVLRQLFQSCRAGGGIVLTVPQHRWLWSFRDELACHKRRYFRAELEAKVREAGFEVLRSTSFVTLLLPFMFLSRLRQRSPSDIDRDAEFRISKALNRFFLACSRLENSFIRFGASLPWGGSLMLLGRKPN
jgi:SAM-dependent methyltransferase